MKKKWNYEKRKDNYPREKWGNFWQYQTLIYNDKIFKAHKKYNHTDRCKVYSPLWFALICKYTGEEIITNLERLNNL